MSKSTEKSSGANQQLSAILLRRGVTCRLITKDGFSQSSVLSLCLVEDKLFINWRVAPSNLKCEIIFLKEIIKGLTTQCPCSIPSDKCLTFVFQSFNIQLGFADAPTAAILSSCLKSMLSEAMAAESVKDTKSNYFQQFRGLMFELAIREEEAYQDIVLYRKKEATLILDKLLVHRRLHRLKLAYHRWCGMVNSVNHNKMLRDRLLWRLHASANVLQDNQAWYQSVFYREIFRLPGPFWFKDAAFSAYKKSAVVDNTLTPLEEAALAHVLCSPDTTYGDVAGQMFVVQAITSSKQYHLFQRLCASGMTIVKFPRSGKPGKKMFRFSFVEGNIFLTWKGKYGNQGIDMVDVTDVVPAISTEVLRKRANAETPEVYLSVLCEDRSIDLCFVNSLDRDDWKGILELLVEKEHGQLVGVKSIRPSYAEGGPISPDLLLEWMLLYENIGSRCIPDNILKYFSVLSKQQREKMKKGEDMPA